MADRSTKKYYCERTGIVDPSINFEILRDFFKKIYDQFEENIVIDRLLNADIIIYGKTKMINILPIKSMFFLYDEVTFFTVMELIYDYIRVYRPYLRSMIFDEELSINKKKIIVT